MNEAVFAHFDAALARAERDYLRPPRELPAVYRCHNCGEGIGFDDDYWPIDGVILCEECIKNMRRTVGEDDFC